MWPPSSQLLFKKLSAKERYQDVLIPQSCSLLDWRATIIHSLICFGFISWLWVSRLCGGFDFWPWLNLNAETFTFKLANMYISFWIGFGHSPALLILGKQQCFSIPGSDWAKSPKFLSQTWRFFSHTEWNVSLTATEQIQKAQLKALHMSRERT